MYFRKPIILSAVLIAASSSFGCHQEPAAIEPEIANPVKGTCSATCFDGNDVSVTCSGTCQIADQDCAVPGSGQAECLDTGALASCNSCPAGGGGNTRSVYTNPATGIAISSGGSFCGASATAVGGVAGGYAGVKALCEFTCTSPTAHVCSSPEMVRYLSTGSETPDEHLWIVAGMRADFSGLPVYDCAGFTTNSAGSLGYTWFQHRPSVKSCDGSSRVACCD